MHHVLERYADVRPFYQQSLEICRKIGDRNGQAIALSNLGEISCTLEDYTQAQAHFAEALEIASETQTLTVLLKILVNLATLFAKRSQTDQAAALLGLEREHPAGERDTQEKTKRLLDEMGLAPPDTVPDSLDSVVAEVLADISPTQG